MIRRRHRWIAAYRERLQHRIDRAPEDVAYRILRARVPFEGTLVEDLPDEHRGHLVLDNGYCECGAHVVGTPCYILPPRVSEDALTSVAAVVLATPTERVSA